MQTFILPVGTSILRGLARVGVAVDEHHWRAQLSRQRLGTIEDPVSLSAELAFLALTKVAPADRLILLATDTADGLLSARVLGLCAENLFQADVEIREVNGLALDDAAGFRREGIPALIQQLDAGVADARQRGTEPVVGIGSGVKATIPHMAVYAMLRHVRIGYAFERPPAVMWLPALPITFDWEAMQAAVPVVQTIRTESAIAKRRASVMLGQHFQAVEGLFEETDGEQLTLSPFGFLVDADMEASEQATVMLSPQATRVLEETVSADERAGFETMLTRVRNPQWRFIRRESFRLSDLDVWKRRGAGKELIRMAGWTAGASTIYIAELFRAHDDYERRVSERRRKDYPVETFAPWKPDTSTLDDLWSPDHELTLRQLRSRIDQAETEVVKLREAAAQAEVEYRQQLEELLNTAGDADQSRIEAEQQAQATRRELARLQDVANGTSAALLACRREAGSLQAKLDALVTMTFWQRLHAAFTGFRVRP